MFKSFELKFMRLENSEIKYNFSFDAKSIN